MWNSSVLCLAIMTSCASSQAQTVEQASNSLVLTGATVIDVAGGPPQPNTTIVISGDRIAALGESGEVETPDDAQVVDASGKFVIPGLWDMHIHWYDKRTLPLFIANGVTGVRQMAGSPEHLAWRQEIADGTLIGPRMELASNIVDGPKAFWPGSLSVTTAEEARDAVRTSQAAGFDFIKVYSGLSRDAYLAIAEEAKSRGLPFAGHVPNAITAAEASDAGQKSVEHLTGVLLGCSAQEAALREEMAKYAGPGAFDPEIFQRGMAKCMESYDDATAAALFARFAKNRTWQAPTLVTARALANLDNEDFTNDPRVKYMPPELVERWKPKNDFRFNRMTPESFASQRAVFEKRLEIVAAMHRAGVGLLAGTDAINPYCFPGFSLHDELELFVKAGLTPTEALQTATRNPAIYLDQEKDFGTVQPGKIADLVLLDADPTADVVNSRAIAAVIHAGKLYDHAALQTMLADAESLANSE